MAHQFIDLFERELERRKRELADAVKRGRVAKETARTEYNRMSALFDFLLACDRRYSGEERYNPEASDLRETLADMAEGDGEARTLWAKWKQENHNERTDDQ